ncbi:MAG: DUF389 domain-containing protein [Flavobacteriaceae bacterium]|nr:DUF389 domain-containing protein [Flavobacteriaceae bacterium]
MEESKFNFSEEEKNNDEAVAKSKEAVKKDAKGLVASVRGFLVELLDFRQDTDREATIEAIKGDVSFKGATAWILICSIFVASVGLNANSTAVVIGAMLISPLMGPILGVGMSIAINDVDTLRKSLINLATMIVLSLLTAFLFFYLFPLSEDTSELLGRTKPDIRDVLIALFGGLALIIARTKRGTIASVIFGVAIATALMPPLCTAGYGLAIQNWEYFGGAMYLFTINTIFIALATFLVIKVLRFPMLKYANSKKRTRIGRIATVLAIAVMVPAVLTFLSVLKESRFNNDAKKYIATELEGLPNSNYIKKNAVFNYDSEAGSVIEITTFGSDEISEDTEELLKQRLSNYNMLHETKLVINQATFREVNNLEYMEELRSRDSLDLLTKQQKINYLENKVAKLSLLERDQIPFDEVVKEVKINYENLEQFSYSNKITSNFKTIDTLKVFNVKWVDSLTTEEKKVKNEERLAKFLKERLDLDSLIVRRYN